MVSSLRTTYGAICWVSFIYYSTSLPEKSKSDAQPFFQHSASTFLHSPTHLMPTLSYIPIEPWVLPFNCKRSRPGTINYGVIHWVSSACWSIPLIEIWFTCKRRYSSNHVTCFSILWSTLSQLTILLNSTIQLNVGISLPSNYMPI